MNDIISLLQSHKSIRKFKNQPISEDVIKAIIQSAQCASTSSFLQTYSIIRINDLEKRKQIAFLSGEQPYIEACPLFLIFCADLHRLETACAMNQTQMAQGWMEPFIVATVDTALAAQNAMVAAESLGLSGVYIGGIRNNPGEICSLLNIPSQVYPVFGMCLGYPDQDPGPKPRLPFEAILKTDTYSTENETQLLEEYDQVIQSYYDVRTKGRRKDTWTAQVSGLVKEKVRPHMKDFLEEQGFATK